MKLVLSFTIAILAIALVPHAEAQSETFVESIDINSPVAWYPVAADIVVRYYTHVVNNLIKQYQVVKYRLERQNALLKQFPAFYGSIGVFYDGDHLKSILSRDPAQNEQIARNLNFTLPQPKMAIDIVDTVKSLMSNLKQMKN